MSRKFSPNSAYVWPVLHDGIHVLCSPCQLTP